MILGEERWEQKEQLTPRKNSQHAPETKEVRLARTECRREKESVQRGDGEAGSGTTCNMGT